MKTAKISLFHEKGRRKRAAAAPPRRRDENGRPRARTTITAAKLLPRRAPQDRAIMSGARAKNSGSLKI